MVNVSDIKCQRGAAPICIIGTLVTVKRIKANK